MEALIRCGACDCFQQTRATLFSKIERTLSRATQVAADRARGQGSLLDLLSEPEARAPEDTRQLPEWPQNQLLAAEKELLGFYVTGHPLTPFIPLLEKYALTNSSSAALLPDRSLTRIGGMVSAVQQGISKKSNKPYAMVTVEDLDGTFSMLCMNENYDRYMEMLKPNTAILIVGEVNNSEDKPKLFPQEIMPLEHAPRKFTNQVHFRLQQAHLTNELLTQARDLARSHTGSCPLFLCLRQPGGELVFIETHERFECAFH